MRAPTCAAQRAAAQCAAAQRCGGAAAQCAAAQWRSGAACSGTAAQCAAAQCDASWHECCAHGDVTLPRRRRRRTRRAPAHHREPSAAVLRLVRLPPQPGDAVRRRGVAGQTAMHAGVAFLSEHPDTAGALVHAQYCLWPRWPRGTEQSSVQGVAVRKSMGRFVSGVHVASRSRAVTRSRWRVGAVRPTDCWPPENVVAPASQ
jgi:hypothetical protein